VLAAVAALVGIAPQLLARALVDCSRSFHLNARFIGNRNASVAHCSHCWRIWCCDRIRRNHGPGQDPRLYPSQRLLNTRAQMIKKARKMKVDSKEFRVSPGKKVDLGKWPTIVEPYSKSKKQYKELLREHMEKLSSLQQLHYASNHYALLVIFQGMDGAGKDGVIRHVMSGVNPEGCEVYSFKQPSAEELQHDFLWRTTCRLPERGRIGIFNRSYYEEVLVVKVHPELLRSEGLPPALRNQKNIWEQRYSSIGDLEKHLHRNGTQTVKIFLHLSYEEQGKRFLERIDEPGKNWKFSASDIHERKYWKHYMRAYEECLQATSTHHAPWYVVPADDKENGRLIVSQIILDALGELKMAYPRITEMRRAELHAIKKLLSK
jgi:PPK2 family polyphosphate:nucleotide phosphotransferase